METAVVYESMFGNTAHVARAIAEGMRAEGAEVEVVPVADAAPDELQAYDLVVVGAPTHALALSRPSTRQDAAEKGARIQVLDPGVREWLAGVPDRPRAAAAVFDTRLNSMRRLPGSAARQAARILRRRHLTLVARPRSFYVGGLTGPLVDGEEQCARDWGAELVRRAADSAYAGRACAGHASG